MNNLTGYIFLLGESILKIMKNIETKLQRVRAYFNLTIYLYYIAIAFLFCAWAVLYSSYLMNHNIPANPGGFYLESAVQLGRNGFLIPNYVQGFGEPGIPFVYPPLSFYVLAVMGYLLGGVLKAALYVPGILLLIQAILMFFFMKYWTGSKQASLWAAMVLLLMPQMVTRTIFADGITTGLSSVFLLFSWITVIKPIDKSNSNGKFIIGGVFVGLSILSHPAIGLFCSVSYSILLLYRCGFNIKAIKRLLLSGIIAFLVILPWLYAVISMHGITPLLAGIEDSKSSLNIFRNTENIYGTIKSTLVYLFDKYVGGGLSNSISFYIFPFILSVIFSIIRGPRILILLLFAGLVIMRGHPSVTMFAMAASIGIFYSSILMTTLSQRDPQTPERETFEETSIWNWQFLLLFVLHAGVLFILSYHSTLLPSFSPGEKETYDWIRVYTPKNSTFLMEGEGSEESLVYFGQRSILLPIMGAEWIPSPEYGNGAARNKYINSEIYQCRENDCLLNLFKKYNVFPDYMIFQIDEENSERDWVKNLSKSCLFDMAFDTGDIVTLHKSIDFANCPRVKP